MSLPMLRGLLKLEKVAASRAAYASAAVANPNVMAGDRQIVGYGMNGQPIYFDRADFPLPGVRFRVDSPDIKALREKEKGDWKKLSVAEKKALYRASFCQTLVEVDAPTGEWKHNFGFSLMLCCSAVWIYMLLKLFVYSPLPDTFEQSKQEAQLRRILDLRIGAIEGISSNWDYDKDQWKK